MMAYNQPTVTFSAEGGFTGNFAVDGNGGTRWGSGFSATESIQVDLGQNTAVNRVVLTWEAAYGRGYTVQVSSDAVTWRNALVVTAGDGGVDDLAVSGTGRYVRILCEDRALPDFGYSLWEFEVYGTAAPAGDLAKNRPATASSVEANAPHLAPGFAVDADATTRWSSAAADPQWSRVDLGTSQALGLVVLDWEAAYGKTYTVEGSNDDVTWTALAPTITNGAPGRRRAWNRLSAPSPFHQQMCMCDGCVWAGRGLTLHRRRSPRWSNCCIQRDRNPSNTRILHTTG